MNFENIISKISATIAIVIVFTVASGMYLSFKGFVMDSNGRPVLVKSANAKDQEEQSPQEKTIEQSQKSEISEDKAPSVDSNKETVQIRILGKKDAPVTIYEYSSFGCFYCAEFHLKTLPKIKQDYVDKGKVKVVFVDFPLDNRSFHISMVSKCIPADKYFDFLDLMFKKQREMSFTKKFEETLTNYASLNGISKERVEECMKDTEIAGEIADARKNAIEKLKIQGTPSFVVESANKSQTVPGAVNYSKFKEIIDSVMPATTDVQ